MAQIELVKVKEANSTLRGLCLEPLNEERLRELKQQLEQSLEAVSRAHAEKETSKPPGLEERAGPAQVSGE